MTLTRQEALKKYLLCCGFEEGSPLVDKLTQGLGYDNALKLCGLEEEDLDEIQQAGAKRSQVNGLKKMTLKIDVLKLQYGHKDLGSNVCALKKLILMKLWDTLLLIYKRHYRK